VNKPSPLDIYRLLPRMNCKECGAENCLAFATKLANREIRLEECPLLLTKQNEKNLEQLRELLRPATKEIQVGSGSKAIKIGGKIAMYRHEFAFFNPTAIAIDVTDEMTEQEILERIGRTANFVFDYIGQKLKLDMIAVRSTSDDPDRFMKTVKTVSESTDFPLILCSLNPKVLEAGLKLILEKRPLLYTATSENWEEMAELAKKYRCPLVVSAPNNLKLLRSLTKTLIALGLTDLVLDPGTYVSNGLADTLNNFTMIRKASCKMNDDLLGFPLLGAPIVAWKDRGETPAEIAAWREAFLASSLIARFADILIMHNLDGWALLPVVILRQNIYTDPRKPASVEPGLKTFGTPDENSPVMFTTNFALTYFTVASDLESAKTNAYLLVVDTGGIAVDSAVAGRRLTAEKIASAIKSSMVENKVKHRKLIIPGKASRLSREIEDLSGWQVLIGPRDSSDIPKFLQNEWQMKA
jgi:acetyl-CoA decarbonylase/synthase complex subunit gamma